MNSSIVGIIFMIVFNTLPNRVDHFVFYETTSKNKTIEFSREKGDNKWLVDDGKKNKDNWCELLDNGLVLGDRGNIDTIFFIDILPTYHEIKWNKFKSLEIEGVIITFEKKRKKMQISFNDEFSDRPMVLSAEW